MKNASLTTIFILILFFAITDVAVSQTAVSNFRNLVAEKKLEEAAAIAPQALNELSNDANFAIAVGDVYFELEEYQHALNAYQQARRINNKDNKIVAKVAFALSALGRTKDAINEVRPVLDKDKKNVSLIIALADAYLKADDITNAQLQITNARSIDNKNPEVYSMLGNIYFKQNI